jgi:sugar phosphate isomerase/epimerase
MRFSALASIASGMLGISLISLFGMFALEPSAAQAADSPAKGVGGNPFFALCMDTHNAKKRTLAQQAEMLDELGFDGAAHLWLKDVPRRLKTLDAHDLSLYQIYVRVSIDPKNRKYDPGLGEVIKLLKGRKTMLGLLLSGGKPSDTAGDQRAVEIVREIAHMAAASDLQVALYPHTNDWLEKTSDAIRIAKKVDRKNVGIIFNLCHWLKVDDTKNLEPLLKRARPHLFTVTINGADPPPGDWKRLIQPLGQGKYDVGVVLRTLGDLQYKGPIGLHCYGLGGDARVHLKQSMTAWKQLSAQMTPSKD